MIINFSNETETVDIKKTFKDMPDLITVKVVGGNSQFKRDQQIAISGEMELQKFESIVAFYNSSLALVTSKVVLLLLIAVCALFN